MSTTIIAPVETTCGFSLIHYRDILRRLRNRGLAFVPFETFLRQDGGEGPYVLLRHDVDVRLQPALEMLEIEVESGVRSTWFMRTRAQGYSLDEPEFRRLRSQVLAAGSEIALHEEASQVATGPDEFVARITQDRRRLEDALGSAVLGVSTHMPKRSRMPVTEALAKRAGFAYEASSARFNPPGIAHFSDANRAWKCPGEERPKSNLCPCRTNAVRMYLAIHPIWWSDLDQSVAEIVGRLRAGD